MQRPDYQGQVLNQIESKPAGTLFIYSDFFEIAEATAIRQILRRLSNEKKVTKIMDGMYVKLEYSHVLKKYIYPSTINVAQTLARKFNWNIYPSKHTALNIVGLSTQISNTYEFLSDGPYRKYIYLSNEISFKKSANKKIKINSDALINLIIALDAYGKDTIKENEVQIISKYIENNKLTEELLDQNKTIPEWMYLVIKNILKKGQKND